MCYAPCNAGYSLIGTVCYLNCPYQYSDGGLTCSYSVSSYGRGIGYLLLFFSIYQTVHALEVGSAILMQGEVVKFGEVYIIRCAHMVTQTSFAAYARNQVHAAFL